MWAALLHPLRWDSPDTPFKVDICPASSSRIGGASHRVQLLFDQAAGDTIDAGVRDLQHDLGKFFGRERSHILFLGLLDYCPDAAERVGEDQAGIYALGHDLV